MVSDLLTRRTVEVWDDFTTALKSLEAHSLARNNKARQDIADVRSTRDTVEELRLAIRRWIINCRYDESGQAAQPRIAPYLHQVPYHTWM